MPWKGEYWHEGDAASAICGKVVMMLHCIPELAIDDYIPRLRSQRKRVPLAGTLELTHRCNNSCIHCYISQPSGDSPEKQNELKYADITRILDETADMGCLWLLLTGGEPLLRKDFKDIYLYAKHKGFLITLFTNGTLITPYLADLLKELPPISVEISIYGATKATYEAVTRAPGSYRKCMKGIELLLDRHIPLKLKTVISTVNRHEFIAIKEFVEGLGLEFRFDALLNARFDASKDVAQFRIPPEDLVGLDLTDPKRKTGFLAHYQKTCGTDIEREFIFRCGEGMNSFLIDPHGKLGLCTLARTPSFDLKSGNFASGWDEFLPKLRKQRYNQENTCRDCGIASICEQCPGWALLEHGDPQARVEYLCRVTHLRAKAFGIPAGHKERRGPGTYLDTETGQDVSQADFCRETLLGSGSVFGM